MTCYFELLPLLVGRAPWLLLWPAVEIESLSRGREARAVHRATLRRKYQPKGKVYHLIYGVAIGPGLP